MSRETLTKMDRLKILMLIACMTLVASTEIDDSEQKKRGASKSTGLNAITTGAQKPEYTYTIYSQNPQSGQPSANYGQSQVPNSFYPSQSTGHYYQSQSLQEQSPVFPPQPQINLIPPPSSSQFVPLNFLPNPGYQSKFQVIPSKTSNGNLQLAIIPQQQSLIQPSGYVPLQQSLFSPSPHVQQNSLLNQIPQQNQFNPQNFQPFSLPQPYVGQPSSMFLYAQPSPSLYNNYVLPNPTQQLYNYFQSNPQAKYNLLYGGASQPNASPHTTEYEKYQTSSSSQPVTKDDNEIIHSSDYITPSETNNNYKNTYSSGPGSSYKS